MKPALRTAVYVVAMTLARGLVDGHWLDGVVLGLAFGVMNEGIRRLFRDSPSTELPPEPTRPVGGLPQMGGQPPRKYWDVG